MITPIKLTSKFTRWNLLILSLLILSGCQTLHDTEFSPVEARLDPLNTGGVQHLVLVNSSGKDLHHYQLRAYIWGDNSLAYTGDPVTTLPAHDVPDRTYTCDASGNKWQPGQIIRFKQRDMGIEGRLLRPVSKVQIVGSCDEGSFRETWQITSFGQLEQTGRPQRTQ